MIRSFFLFFLIFASNSALGEEYSNLPCLVPGIDGKKMREASPSEASREAGSIWRSVSSTPEAALGTNWISKFISCSRASGLPMEAFFAERKKFEKKLSAALRNDIKEIRDEKDVKQQSSKLEKYESQVLKLIVLDPSLKSTLDALDFSKEEKEKLKKQYSEYVEKEKADCKDVDFSSRLGPVRDQSDKGWCYAFTAADLVTYRLGPDTANFSRRVSAADIAFNYNYENISLFERIVFGMDLGSESGGMMGDALKAALGGGGFCLEKNAPSEGFLFGRLDETIRDIRAILDEETPSADQFCYTYLRVQDMFPGIDLDSYSNILSATQDSNYKYFKSLNQKNCEGKRHTYGIERDQVVDANLSTTKIDSLISSIDHQLDQSNPTAIGYKTKMITHDGTGNHANVVVGRKYDNESKSCKYLLRNSWGTACVGSLRKELCDSNHLGHLWVTKEALKENLFHITYIKP